MIVEGFGLRLLSAKRIRRLNLDVETYVVETSEPYDTHGQVQLAKSIAAPETDWWAWCGTTGTARRIAKAAACKRNEPRRYELRRVP